MMADDPFRPAREPLVPPGEMEIFARDMTATIAADITLAEVQRRLGELGQWLPIDGDPGLSIGELVEINSSGPLRLGYGAWRDLLLGCQFTNGRGELITAGGRTVKNVAGYDLTKFMVGQQGIFGRIVTMTTRTYQRPAGALLLKLEPDVRRIAALLPTSRRPQWAILCSGQLLLGYLGDEEALAFWESQWNLSDVPDARRTVQADIEHRAALFSRTYDDGVTFRASVPPARISEFIDSAELASSSSWAADAAFGIVRGNCPEDRLAALREAAGRVGGAVWRERGETPDTLSPDDAVLRDLLHRLRRAFAS
jgi:hypothetical protein